MERLLFGSRAVPISMGSRAPCLTTTVATFVSIGPSEHHP